MLTAKHAPPPGSPGLSLCLVFPTKNSSTTVIAQSTESPTDSVTGVEDTDVSFTEVNGITAELRAELEYQHESCY